jgi:hypothetical protein
MDAGAAGRAGKGRNWVGIDVIADNVVYVGRALARQAAP